MAASESLVGSGMDVPFCRVLLLLVGKVGGGGGRGCSILSVVVGAWPN